MTLKEKFAKILTIPLAIQGFYIDWDKVEECEQIADEFAIGFAEWYLNLWHTDDDSSFDNNSPQELLEIYKKENELWNKQQ